MLDEPNASTDSDLPTPPRGRRSARRPAGPPKPVPEETPPATTGKPDAEFEAELQARLQAQLGSGQLGSGMTENEPSRSEGPDADDRTEGSVQPAEKTTRRSRSRAADGGDAPARRRTRKRVAPEEPAETPVATGEQTDEPTGEQTQESGDAGTSPDRAESDAIDESVAAEPGTGPDDESVESAESAVEEESGTGDEGTEQEPGSEDDSGSDDDSADSDSDEGADEDDSDGDEDSGGEEDAGDDESTGTRRRRRRRGGRRRRRSSADDSTDSDDEHADSDDDSEDNGDDHPRDDSDDSADDGGDDKGDDNGEASGTSRRRRRRRRRRGEDTGGDDDPDTDVVVKVREPRRNKAADEVTGIEGSTRMEAKRQRRREGRAAGRRRTPILSEAEFLARRESVQRTMVIRQNDELAQIAVLEDGVLVEHYVDRASATSLIGNVYLGRVQNVLPSMEAAFVDIGRGRNAVLYAGEVDWDSFGAEGQQRKVENVLKSGQTILVQVTKDPVGAKGARLTNNISLPGRYIVYSPGGHLSGISRKLPDTERKRLKTILSDLVGEDSSVIVRTAAEGASEEELVRDVNRLKAQWEAIEKKVKGGVAPAQLYAEPDATVRIVRDLFTEDFGKLIIHGNGSSTDAYDTVMAYVSHVAPHLAERIERWDDSRGDVFAAHRIDEQIAKALERKVYLPSGGSLVIDRTEAMTVIDVNTGKFTGSGGNLEATVTSNNLEAAEEVVRQLRLRDIGGIIVIDFIDMVLPSNRELLLRRLVECLGRDRTRHQVAEVTSLGLVQMTRKKIGTGLAEAFTETCEVCKGRGFEIHDMPVESQTQADGGDRRSRRGRGRGGHSNSGHHPASEHGHESASEKSGDKETAKASDRDADKETDKEPDKPADRADRPSDSDRSDTGRNEARKESGRSRRRSRSRSADRDEAAAESPTAESASEPAVEAGADEGPAAASTAGPAAADEATAPGDPKDSPEEAAVTAPGDDHQTEAAPAVAPENVEETESEGVSTDADSEGVSTDAD